MKRLLFIGVLLITNSAHLDAQKTTWESTMFGNINYALADAKTHIPSLGLGINVQRNFTKYFFTAIEVNRNIYNGEKQSEAKKNFVFTSKTSDFSFLLGLKFSYKKISAQIAPGFGWVSYRSKCNFTDYREYLVDPLSNLPTTIKNPNYLKYIVETAESRRWIVPVNIQLAYAINPKLSVVTKTRYAYMRDDDIDVYNTPIWVNRWFDNVLNFSVGATYRF